MVGPLCAYDALEVLWRRMVGGDPPVVQADWLELNLGGGKLAKSHPMASKPIFAHPNGAAICTEDVRRMARRFASAAGEDPADFGASSLRSGGATDLRAAFGDDESSKTAIKQRGRWESDIAEIYQRALLRSQLDASAAIGSAEGLDLETACLGWSQRTTHR